VLYFLRRSDEAVAQLQRTLQIDPNFVGAHLILGLVDLQRGKATDAVAELRKAVDLGGRNAPDVAMLAYASARAGDTSAAHGLLAELTERAQRHYVLPSAFAILYTGLGDHERAFAWLNEAVDARDLWLGENVSDPLFDPLRSDARFARVLRKMGLE
jgi:tetratricopeptide (TPR) repeat protein